MMRVEIFRTFVNNEKQARKICEILNSQLENTKVISTWMTATRYLGLKAMKSISIRYVGSWKTWVIHVI